MNVNFSMKQRKGDKWEHIDLAAVAGKTLEEIFRESVGKEVVSEIVIDSERFYFCGTAFWLERMQRKGKAAMFLQAIDILLARCPHLLKNKIPGVQEVADVFHEPGATMETCTFENVASRFDL